MVAEFIVTAVLPRFFKPNWTTLCCEPVIPEEPDVTTFTAVSQSMALGMTVTSLEATLDSLAAQSTAFTT